MIVDPMSLPSAPYKGIESFRFVDHAIFFARGTETLELLRRVVIYKGCLLFGTSGAGKSPRANRDRTERSIRRAPEDRAQWGSASGS